MQLRKAHVPKSFSYIAKDEICTHEELDEGRAELAGMLLAASSASAAPVTRKVQFTTENLPVAKRLVRIVLAEFGLGSNVRMNRSPRRNSYTVAIDDAGPILDGLGITPSYGEAVPAEHLATRDKRIALLRGSFLACGSVSNPKKNYHLEFAAGSSALAGTLKDILNGFAIRSNIVPRREHFVLYLNEGDSIAALLALIGAHTSILNLENIRIFKETRNNVNRAVNCETANINKTVNAAQAQVDSIRKIEREIGLGHLSQSLREAAELRLEHPEASLKELCELCGTTKSGMNHRLRKINAIARALSEEE